MAFCVNCGSEIKTEDRFCNSCGAEVQENEKDVSVVRAMSCPQCGAMIRPFTGRCEFCGTVIWNLDASKAIKEFAQKLSEADSEQQQLNLIKAFPIPNTKEDIMEFMILASSNIGYHEEMYLEKYEDAWMAKFMQGYQKAKIIFGNDSDFSQIQKMYVNTLERRKNAEDEKKVKAFQNLLIKNLGVGCGMAALFIAFIMDIFGSNSSLLQLAGLFVLIVSASTLKKREAERLDYILVAGSGFITIVLSFLFHNGSVLMLGGVITILVSGISYLKK